jgi:phosphatidylinositol alpha-1,6-mannosyltransferase
MSKKIILLTLQTFSATGGIQKMSRTLTHSLQYICEKHNWKTKLLSLYDANDDLLPKYLSRPNFKGFNKNKTGFILYNLLNVTNNDVLILSHINFAIIGVLIKLLKPKSKVWLIAHGIEVWRPLSFQKQLLLKYCDKIVCVSEFTKNRMLSLHNVNADKCRILNNAIDPFIELPNDFTKPDTLFNRYGLTKENQVIFTLTRLASTEKYKGYDNVIIAVGRLKTRFPNIKYILSGKYDEQEEQRVKALIQENGVTANVLLTGFIEEAELVDHFLLADLFVLPSKKEGFGIVFIEALACGLPVICGNADGSVDAIRNGELGKAIDPDNNKQLEEQIAEHLMHPLTLEKRKFLQEKCLQYFNGKTYIDNLQELLAD